MSAAAWFAIPMVVAVACALPLRRLAVRLGILDRPGPRKLQARPVPYLGGAAVLMGTLAGTFLDSRLAGLLVVLVGAQAVGLIDDVAGLGVRGKLLAQLVLAVAAVAFGVTLRVTGVGALDGALTVAWLVGIANAFNLLDNMDGLCATVAAVAALGLAVLAPGARPLALPLAGAVAGFLLVNLPPARMYLGDAGSMTIGFAVGACTVIAAGSASGPGALLRLGLPVAVAVFDTTLVMASRLLTGLPVAVGGLDHFSHRLRLLGWDTRLILLAAALAAGAGPLAAWAATRYPEPVIWVAPLIAVLFAAAWLLLLRIDPYRPASAREPGSLHA
ncbi:MAG TPA: MraY family glycosyltransferase [Candidatus Dormibacteraeota bacterium]|nr:MraY family glycosyltransferase [Candidatus Dormibacteraeota bacterium]